MRITLSILFCFAYLFGFSQVKNKQMETSASPTMFLMTKNDATLGNVREFVTASEVADTLNANFSFDNIYNIDGTLTGTRSLSLSGYDLTFLQSGIGDVVFYGNNAVWTNYTNSHQAKIGAYNSGTFVGSESASPFEFRIGNTAQAIIESDGDAYYYNDLGIGISPAYALDVVGEFRLNNATEGIDRVLRSDANGLASWVDLGTLGGGTDDQTLQEVLTSGNDAGGLDALNFAEVEADEFIGDLRGAVLFKAQAGETLAKGDVVYVSGISGNTTIVSKADADDAAKMPAFGVVAAAASSPNPVDIYTFGTLSNLNTSAFSIGDILYVSTTAGQLTATPPTGESALLQNIAKVTRVDNSAGSIKISGAGRTNATPNLNTGRLFVGNASNQAVADGTIYVDIANSRVGIGTTPSVKLDVVGEFQLDNATSGTGKFLKSTNANGLSEWTTITESDITDLDHYSLADLLTEDGAGSGLDADLLDGQSGAYYLDNTDTQLTQEQVEDYAFDVARHGTGTQTLIAVTYDDVSNNVDYVVENDLSLYDNSTSGFLTTEVDGSTTNEIQDISTTGAAGNISISSGSTLNLNVNDADANATNEIQTIDVSQLVGTDLQLSLSSDGEATKIIDLSSLDDSGTDDQTLQEVTDQGSTTTNNMSIISSGNAQFNIESNFPNSTNTGLYIDNNGDSSIGRVFFEKDGTPRGGLSYIHNASGGSEYMTHNVSGRAAFRVRYNDIEFPNIATDNAENTIAVIDGNNYIATKEVGQFDLNQFANSSGYVFTDDQTLQEVLNQGNIATGTDINLDSGGFFYDSGVGVGIGTASPDEKLQVSGDIHIENTNTYLRIDRSSTNRRAELQFETAGLDDWVLGSVDSDDHSGAGDGTEFFIGTSTGGGQKLWIEASGNVGIRTTAPLAKLHALETASGDVAIFENSSTNQSSIRISGDNTSVDYLRFMVDSDDNYSYFIRGGDITTHYDNVDTYIWRSNGSAERMRLNSTGLGIGTTPNHKLDVNLGGSSAGRLVFDNTVTNIPKIVARNTTDSKYRFLGLDGADVRFYDDGVFSGSFSSAGIYAATINTGTSGDILIQESGIIKQRTLAGIDVATEMDITGLVNTDDQTLQEVTDQGATTTNSITIDETTTGLTVLGGHGTGVPIADFRRDDVVDDRVYISANASEPQVSFIQGDGVNANDFSIGVGFGGSFEIADNTYLGTNTRFVIDNTGEVGIGTVSPSAKLHVASQDAIEISGHEPFITWNNETAVATTLVQYLDNYFAFKVNGGVDMVIEDGGNVGIGTTSPDERLEVYNGSFKIDRGNGVSFVTHGFGDQLDEYGMITNVDPTDFFMGGAVSNDIIIGTRGNSSGEGLHIGSFNGTAFTSQMLVETTTGNVGIGTSSPSKQLTIQSDGNAESLIETTIDALAATTLKNADAQWRIGVEPFDDGLIFRQQDAGYTVGEALKLGADLDIRVYNNLRVDAMTQDDAESQVVVWDSGTNNLRWRDVSTIGDGDGIYDGSGSLSSSTTVTINGYGIDFVGSTDEFSINSFGQTSWTEGSNSSSIFQSGTGFYIQNATSLGSIQLRTGTSPSTALYVKYDGNIGVNTLNPSAQLDVVGDTELNGEVTWSEEAHAYMYAAGITSDTDGTPDNVDFTSGITDGFGNITTNTSTDLIEVTNAGKYVIAFSGLLKCTSSTEDVEVYIEIDNVRESFRPYLFHSNSTSYYSYSGMFTKELSAGADIELMIHSIGGSTCTIDDAYMEVTRDGI